MSLHRKIIIIIVSTTLVLIAAFLTYAATRGDVSDAATTYSQFKSDDIAHGWSGTCPWSIDKDGTLTLWEGTPESCGYNVSGIPNYYTYSKPSEANMYKYEEYHERQADGSYKTCWYLATIDGINPWNPWRTQIKRAIIKDAVILKSAQSLFAGCSKMEQIVLPADMSQCTSLAGTFGMCRSLAELDFRGKNMDALEDMYSAFGSCDNLQWVYLSDIKTNHLKSMRYTFSGCEKLKNVDLSNFDVSNCEDMEGLFCYCYELTSIDFRNFNVQPGILTNSKNQSSSTAHSFTLHECRNIQRVSFGDVALNKELTYAGFCSNPPTTAPYTGKWICEENSSIVLTTQQLIENYPSEIAPKGTYVWQTSAAVISFDANGGMTTEPTITQNGTSTTIRLPRGETTTHRDGHQIVAWNTERDGSGTHYYLGQRITPEQGKNLILYAQWKAIEDYPDKLVNGDFEHMDASLFSVAPANTNIRGNYVACNDYERITQQTNGNCDYPLHPLPLPDWMNKDDFGWRCYADSIPEENYTNAWNYYGEQLTHDGILLEKHKNRPNIFADVQIRKYYQDIKTVPGTMYKWSLSHASRDNTKDNALTVLIGSPSTLTPQSAYRTSTNGAGDAIGPVGTTIRTHNSNANIQLGLDDQWEQYEGSYIVPDRQRLTRFTFAGSEFTDQYYGGSSIDNIKFSRAYPLYYDMNDDGTSWKASREGIYEDEQVADNGAQGYLNENEDTPLTAKVPTREGYKFLGWSAEKMDSLPQNADLSSLDRKLCTSIALSEATTVYAVWQENFAPLEYVINGYDSLNRNGIYEDPFANDNQGCHEIGARVALTDAKPTRVAHDFLGWSSEQIDDIAYLDDEKRNAFLVSTQHITEIAQMPAEDTKVYAVWQEKYSRKILNGDFEYPRMSFFDYYNSRWVGISLSAGTYEHGVNLVGKISDKVPDWKPKQYAWYSTIKANESTTQDGMTEIQREIGTDNQYADLAYGPVNSDVYQDIITIPNCIYKWRIKQCSNTTTFNDILNVKIGALNSQSLQPGWRTTQNTLKKDPLGYVGINMSTTVAQGGNFNHKDQWEQYEGVYSVPDGQWVTRFRFCMANNNGTAVGCLVDDIDFSLAYPLTFDVNGGTNKNIYTDPAANNYAGYHQEGESVTLPTAPESFGVPSGCTFIGWTTEKHATLTNKSTQEEKDAVRSALVNNNYTMPASSVILYAAYAETASISADNNEGGTIANPSVTYPDNSPFPTYTLDVNPLSGFKISQILVDGQPIELPELTSAESYTVTLNDVIGKHEIRVTFDDMHVEVPSVGMNAGAWLLDMSALGVVMLITVLSSTTIRKRKPRKRS